MKRSENFLPADPGSLQSPITALAPVAPYVFNEGQLTLRVLQERSLHMLTLAQDDGVPLTLSLSRGPKEEGQTLHDSLQQQLQSVAQDARHFQQQPLQPFNLPQVPTVDGWRATCLVTEVTYQLGELPVHQAVAVIQLDPRYLLFVTLTRPQGFTPATRQEWQRILRSFTRRPSVLPEPGGDLFGGTGDAEDDRML